MLSQEKRAYNILGMTLIMVMVMKHNFVIFDRNIPQTVLKN